MTDLFRIVGDTAARMASANPVLALCQEGIETDTLGRKTGDGATAWLDLPYSAQPLGDLLALFAKLMPLGPAILTIDADQNAALLAYGALFGQLVALDTAADGRTLLGLGDVLSDINDIKDRLDAHDATLAHHEERLGALES